jgi:hypothetical protein
MSPSFSSKREAEEALAGLRRSYDQIRQASRIMDSLERRAHVLSPAERGQFLEDLRGVRKDLAAVSRRIVGLGKALGHPLDEIDDWLE